MTRQFIGESLFLSVSPALAHSLAGAVGPDRTSSGFGRACPLVAVRTANRGRYVHPIFKRRGA
jgi:hypothetical protein